MKSFIFTHMHGRPPAHTHAHMRMHTCTHTHTHTHTELCACDKDTNILRCNFGATLCVRQKSNGRESMANGIYVCWIIIPMHWSCMRQTSHQCNTHKPCTLAPCTGWPYLLGQWGFLLLSSIVCRVIRHSAKIHPLLRRCTWFLARQSLTFRFALQWETSVVGLARSIDDLLIASRDWLERGGGRGRKRGGGHRIAHENKLRTRKCCSSMKSVGTIMFPKSCTKLDKIAELLLETFVNHWKNFLPE